VADDFFLTGKRREANPSIQREIHSLYRIKLEELRETGLLKDLGLTVPAFTLFGTIGSFFKWYREGGSLSKEDVAQNVFSIIFNGILKDKKIMLCVLCALKRP